LSRTFFSGISELPFAYGLVVNSTGLRLHKYWDIDPRHEIRYRNNDEYYEHFTYLFRQAVRCPLRSQGPIGAELSGGFDSSAIVCVAQELYGSGGSAKKGFVAFSMVFDELRCDERPQIQSVLKKYPLGSWFVVADDLFGLQNFPVERNDLSAIDSPDQLVLQKAGDALYRLAQDRNIRVMLSGEGAENHVMGTHFIIDSLFRGRQWRDLWKRRSVIRSQSSLRATAGHLIKYGFIPLLPVRVSKPLYDRWMHPELHETSLFGWLTSSFRDTIDDELSKQNDIVGSFPWFREWGRQLEYDSLNPSTWLTRDVVCFAG
jgi:asparagine synthetase B (glutamine-hydrolysing)